MRKLIFGFLSVLVFSGCVTTTLQTKATMSQSVFIEPVNAIQKVIFVSVKNTIGEQINLQQSIEAKLSQKGYKITQNPDEATFILQANILYCDIKQENNAKDAAILGGAAGAGVGVYNHSSATGGVVGGLAGAAVGGLLGKLTEDKIFQMQVDINIRQKKQEVLANSAQRVGQSSVSNQQRAGFLNSFGGNVRDTQGGGRLYDNIDNYNQQVYERNYIEHQTTLFAEATKLNLTLEEAIPVLEDKISNQISGIF
ncbi:complement resistance protein TraT [Helicobacter winghamensis]|uniref:Conjugal transfer protein TraT n=1 Tax=Helicobacter winghamensis TaxID=157268 RepID=A0A2N3PLD9_9HELI|nr:complement resistance protein TraT [Helicobacter winghamensis]PKT75091.1 conjugal transfer protein TraT [Helicobacter winghamensis]PKT82607.1 conjugal transfer protein TraT [Helicobacter winghamensis]PKT82799.1 conjugal transfer protein TraT [Helicobacter winghamensis]